MAAVKVDSMVNKLAASMASRLDPLLVVMMAKILVVSLGARMGLKWAVAMVAMKAVLMADGMDY